MNTEEGDSVDTSPISSAAEGSGKLIDELDAKMAKLASTLKKQAEGMQAAGSSPAAILGFIDGVESVTKSVKGSHKVINGFSEVINNTLGKAFVTAGGGAGGLKSMFSKMQEGMTEAAGIAEKTFGGKIPSGIAAAKLAAASFAEGGLALIDEKIKGVTGVGFNDIETAIISAEKASLKAGMSFGQSFDEAAQTTEMYRRTMSDAINTTKATGEEIGSVRVALSAAFNTEEMVGNLDNLTSAEAGVKSAMNLTNVAILTAAATGMESSAMAGLLAEAHLNLGESVETAGMAMADIAAVTQGSGLSFNTVQKGIMNSASALKMWGGTISSVTPVFKTFVDSLGEGRKGLATELLEKYANGLGKMGFSTRALLGTISGISSGGGGAIGAGLEMEAAMEQGPEGMSKITDSLLQTLNKFGGGQGVITRDEAIADPALQRNFMLQRGLLTQMLGVDEQSANQLLGVLKDVDKNGLSGGKNTKEELNKLIKSGEATKESTQTTMERTSRAVESATLDSGKLIVTALGNVAKDLGLSAAADSILAMVDNVGKNIGEDSTAAQRSAARNEAISGVGGGRQVVSGAVSVGGAGKDIQSMSDRAIRNISRGMSKLEVQAKGSGRQPTAGRVAGVVQKALDPLHDELNRLGRKGTAKGGLSKSDERRKATLQQTITRIESKAQGKTFDEHTSSDFKRSASDVGRNRVGANTVSSRRKAVRALLSKDSARPTLSSGAKNENDIGNATDISSGVKERKERVRLNFKSEPIEQEIILKISSDAESVLIKTDDDHIKKIVRITQTSGHEG